MTAQQFQILWPQTHTSRDFRFSRVWNKLCSVASACSLNEGSSELLLPRIFASQTPEIVRIDRCGSRKAALLARSHTHSSEYHHPLISVCTAKEKKKDTSWIFQTILRYVEEIGNCYAVKLARSSTEVRLFEGSRGFKN